MYTITADASFSHVSMLIHQLVEAGEREIEIIVPPDGLLFHDLQNLYDFELLQGMSLSLKWKVTFQTDSLLIAELARVFGFNAVVLDDSEPEPGPEELWPTDDEDELLRIATPSAKGFLRLELDRNYIRLEQLLENLIELKQGGQKDFLIQVPVDSPLFRVWDDFVTMQDAAVKQGLNIRFESFLPTFVLMANTAGFYVTQHPRLQSATIDELKAYAEIMRNSEYSSLQRLSEVIEPTIALMEEGHLEEAGRILNERAARYVMEFFANPANRIRFDTEDINQHWEGAQSLKEVIEEARLDFNRRYRSAS